MLNQCNVCESTGLTTIWELPKFPLTGIYEEKPKNSGYQNLYDQELQFCSNCTHAQLGNQIDPVFLYRETYTHRTSESPISSSGNKYLLNFIKSITRDRKFEQVLEIGCNDLYLLDNLKDQSKYRAGLDPIWEDGVSVSESGVRLWGGFAENADYSLLLDSKVDLIVTAHTFEHVTDPRKAILSLEKHLSDDCIFIIEVPSAERMLEQGRLDQVFNQHVNYYSVKSLETLLQPLGFNLVNLNYNYSYWGGTQLLAFSKNKEFKKQIETPVLSAQIYKDSIQTFLGAMLNVSRQIEAARGSVYLYGAAQMLPPLIYHFSGSAIRRITAIIDDNESRQGRYFPDLEIEIKSPSDVGDFSESTIVVSALDSSRVIISRILPNNPRSVIIPNGLI